jgi:hypothetical protein
MYYILRTCTYIVNVVNYLIAKKLLFALLYHTIMCPNSFTKYAANIKGHIPICKLGLKANLIFRYLHMYVVGG